MKHSTYQVSYILCVVNLAKSLIPSTQYSNEYCLPCIHYTHKGKKSLASDSHVMELTFLGGRGWVRLNIKSGCLPKCQISLEDKQCMCLGFSPKASALGQEAAVREEEVPTDFDSVKSKSEPYTKQDRCSRQLYFYTLQKEMGTTDTKLLLCLKICETSVTSPCLLFVLRTVCYFMVTSNKLHNKNNNTSWCITSMEYHASIFSYRKILVVHF